MLTLVLYINFYTSKPQQFKSNIIFKHIYLKAFHFYFSDCDCQPKLIRYVARWQIKLPNKIYDGIKELQIKNEWHENAAYLLYHFWYSNNM